MNILIDLNHPAHVHVFRNAAKIWMAHGHRVIITIREREMVADLLRANGLEFIVASRQRFFPFWYVWELFEHDWNVLKVALKYKADLLIGTSAATCHVSRVTKGKSIFFDEDDEDYHKSGVWLTHPFADTIVIPQVLRDRRTPKHVTYNSLHELAYLHPNQFTPDPAVLKDLGVAPGEPYFIVRLVSMRAYHDTGHAGLSLAARRRLVETLSQKGRVFITIEGKIPDEFKPYQMPIPPHLIHHALYYATMLVCDSQTMTIEAGLLGTPAVRCNTFVGLCSVIEELEHKYDLVYGFLPQDEEPMFAKIEALLADPLLKQKWAHKRARLLEDKIDFTAWMVDFIEGYPGNLKP